jgi:subtilisin family serine protease
MIRDAGEKGVLFIAAAGNSGISLDNYPEYPAAFSLANQLTVGASTSRDYTAGFSNYSYNFVNLFAPGSNINSTYPGARTAILSGTSMAAPFVSGAAALLFSDRPRATPQQIRQALLAGVDQGGFAATSRGRLNVRKSLDEIRRLVAP